MTLRRIIPPKCTACGVANADYESIDDSSNLRLCHECVKQTLAWLWENGLAEGNPWALALADGYTNSHRSVGPDGREGINVMLPTHRGSTVFTYRFIGLPAKILLDKCDEVCYPESEKRG